MYTKHLTRCEYTKLSEKDHASYYLDYLNSFWEANIKLNIHSSDSLETPSECPDTDLTGQAKTKGNCNGCNWFLGKENLTNLGCCGLLLHNFYY